MNADPEKIAERITQLETNRDEVQAIVNYLDAELDSQQRELTRIERQIEAVRALTKENR